MKPLLKIVITILLSLILITVGTLGLLFALLQVEAVRNQIEVWYANYWWVPDWAMFWHSHAPM